MIVKVATFRNAVDHLFRVVNVDYHACVGAAELRNWQGIAGRVLAEVDTLECKRANQDDREQQRRSIEAARERMSQAAQRIAQLEAFARPAVGCLQ